MNEKIDEAGALIASGRIVDGMALAEAEWRSLEGSDRWLEKAQCQRVLSAGHQVAGRIKESLIAGYRAIEMFDKLGEVRGLARTMSMQAIGLARSGDAAEALNLATRAMELLDRIDDTLLAGRIWNNLSVVYESLGQMPQAVAAVEQALPLAERMQDENLLAVCRGNLWQYRLVLARQGSSLADEEAALQAVAALAEHMNRCEAAGRRHLVGGMAERAGETLIDLGRLEEARPILRQGLRCARQEHMGPEQARIELQLARLERLAGQYRAAGAHMAHALELVLASDDKDVIARCHLENSCLQEAQAHWRAALDSHKRYADMREALLRAQAETRAQVMAVRLEAERSRHEAELRQRDASAAH